MEAGTVPRDYHHPYQPYAIQRQFMDGVYDCLEQGKIGIFESPTGTGKSLSLICSSMTWLRNLKSRNYAGGAEERDSDGEEPTWLYEHARQQRQQTAIRHREQQEHRLAKIREKEARTKARYELGGPPPKRQRTDDPADDAHEDDESSFLLADYESAGEQPKINGPPATGTGLSANTQALMDKLGLSVNKKAVEEDEEPEDELKIFFCSRTHSQISQFVNELRRVKLPPALSDAEAEPESGISHRPQRAAEEMKHITLGSRKNLCINQKVRRLGNTTAINERCLELQQATTNAASKCQYMPKKDNEALVLDFRDHVMARIRDIEDFASVGKGIGICPYYASRAAVKPSEIVTLPYPLLLQKSAREALDISLRDHVVIIDEAHNLMDTIANIHSVSISLEHLKRSRAQLSVYLQKFRNKLKGKNRVYVTQLVRLIDSLAAYLELKVDEKVKADGEVQVSDFLTGKGMDQINLYKLTKYVQESKIARKVERYLVHAEEQTSLTAGEKPGMQKSQQTTPSTPVLTQISSFLEALTNPAAEGRFFYNRSTSAKEQVDVTISYLLLDPTEHFREIVSEARAVILAGGTMSPMDDYINHLFHYLPLERIETLSCGHVIPPSSLVAMPVVRGPSGIDFDFTFEKRNDKRMIEELSHAILQFTKSVPDGLVVFFPSYAYLDMVTRQWQFSGKGVSIWTLLERNKRIFMEPRSSSASTSTPAAQPVSTSRTTTPPKQSEAAPSKIDTLLATYSAHIHSTQRSDNGALLLAVIGGSLSEGINFSDRLGRGVCVVGLPFPNSRTPEWKARLEFIEARSRPGSGRQGGAVGVRQGGKGQASREYLENVCMRAVNQSVGRAIRHKDDYAAIMLLDKRYERENIRMKLPGWIKESFKPQIRWNGVVDTLDSFFKDKD